MSDPTLVLRYRSLRTSAINSLNSNYFTDTRVSNTACFWDDSCRRVDYDIKPLSDDVPRGSIIVIII